MAKSRGKKSENPVQPTAQAAQAVVQAKWPRPVSPTAIFFLQGIIQQEAARQVGAPERFVG